MDHLPHAKYWLALATTSNGNTQRQLLRYFKDPEIILKTPVQQLVKKTGLSLSQIQLKPNWQVVEQQLQLLTENKAKLLVWTDTHYPPRLREISHPPLILFVLGNVEALLKPQLAIVGSRQPSLEGIKIAKLFTLALARSGLAITSGLAFGIDKACHASALQTDSPTIAVLGSGLNNIYPAAHQALTQQIIEQQGAIVSEFLFNTPPRAANFPQRNRIISGLSLGTLVIEAAQRSGSLITARLALEQNREVFAVPGSIYNSAAAGCHYLLKEGAKLVVTPEDVLEEFSMLN